MVVLFILVMRPRGLLAVPLWLRSGLTQDVPCGRRLGLERAGQPSQSSLGQFVFYLRFQFDRLLEFPDGLADRVRVERGEREGPVLALGCPSTGCWPGRGPRCQAGFSVCRSGGAIFSPVLGQLGTKLGFPGLVVVVVADEFADFLIGQVG